MRLFSKREVDIKEKIEEIHHSFNIEGEKLLKEAREVLAIVTVTKEEKKMAERLGRVGFNLHPLRQLVAKKEESIRISEKMAQIVEYYNFYYPQNKFIDRVGVEKLCYKYNLYCGPVSNYIGGIPLANLEHVEKFHGREEDKVYQVSTIGGWNEKIKRISYKDWTLVIEDKRLEEQREMERSNREGILEQVRIHHSFRTSYHHYSGPHEQLSICAPEKDFKLDERQKKVGKFIVTIPDPVVLYPVFDGYLIVTAWGLEASDDLVMNPKHN